MASAIMRRPSLPPVPAPSRTDEELINKSLLDSLDEQADAEPLSSDSEAPTATTGSGSATSSSVTSPSGHFRSNVMHPQLSRPDSPTYTKSAHGFDPYLQHMQSPTQSLYNNHSIISSQEDVTPRQHDKIGLAPSTFRSSNSYGSLANGRVHDAIQPPTGFRSFQEAMTVTYAAENQPQAPLPGRPGQGVDPAAASARRYDFMNGPPGVQSKASFGTLESFAAPGAQPNTSGPKVGATAGPRQHGGYHAPSQPGFGGAMSAMQSQTPFGPHLPAVGPTPGVNSVAMGPVSGPTQTTQQEEISTIFVVGFPDDMQEREFQNMFTFSPGFEAATLKIPNKELTSYGPGSAGLRSAGFGNFGQNDPYNLVTMNQGGVLVDNGRDGTTTSWGAGHDDGHFGNGPNMTPRKQIIGFAKFRTRQEALDAREILQGRRVDAEKGAVLKAEMAKKNLHTKRGVGQPGMPSNASGPMNGGDALSGYSGLNGLGSPTGPGEALSARERELGALGAMGFASLGQRRDRVGDDERSVMQMQGMMGTRGARERAEEDERDRERRRREQELKLRNTNSSAFDAFHSVPQQMGRNAPPNPLLASVTDDIPARFNMSALSGQDTFGMNSGMDPWTQPPRELLAAGGPIRKVPSSLNSATFMRHTESHQGSPTNFDDFPSGPNSTSSQDGFDSDAHSNPDTGPFSPQMMHQQPVTLLKRGAHVFHPRAASPAAEHGHGHPQYAQAPSSASSTSGSSQIGQDEFSGAMAGLNLNGPHGDGSPQLPSPVSNTSSGSGQQKGNVDQNPPINTLYVGNLPSSPLLSYSNHLEESLKALFARCQGFRKLCFRQKANGPMCFVEFEDVHFATKALNDLYGHTLDGMIKNGGIRLSYSKNPLGVRPPNSAANANNGQLQAQQSISSQTSPFLNDAFVPRGIPSRGVIDNVSTPVPRKDTLELPRSPPAAGYNFNSLNGPQQPPRFASASPNAGAFPPASVPFSSTAFPRANPQGFGLPPPGTTGGAPFSSFGRRDAGPIADNNTNTDRLMHALPPLTT